MSSSKVKSKFLSIAVLATCTAAIVQSPSNAGIKDINRVLSQTASELNQQLPMMVDRETQWDSAFAGPGKLFSYNYTLVNYSASQIDGSQFSQDMYPMLVNVICTNPATKFFPENGVMLNYNYYDNARIFITTVEIAPSDCYSLNSTKI